MPKFLISWDSRQGLSVETVEAKDENMARTMAYDRAMNDLLDNLVYTAEPLTKQRAEEFNLEWKE